MNTDKTITKSFCSSLLIRVHPCSSVARFHYFRGASQDSRGVSGHDGIRRDAAGDYASGSHHGILADREVGQDGGARPNRSPALDQGGRDLPILLGLQGAARRRGARVDIVDERHPVPDEDVVLNGYAFADEGVAGDLAVAPHPGVLLDLDKRADLGVIAHLAAVQVDEPGELDVLTQLDVWCDAEVFGHWKNKWPRLNTDEHG